MIYSLENIINGVGMTNETSGHKETYITTKEAAEELGYTVQHTRLLARKGQLEANKFGRDWMILKESVVTYRVKQSQETEHQNES